MVVKMYNLYFVLEISIYFIGVEFIFNKFFEGYRGRWFLDYRVVCYYWRRIRIKSVFELLRIFYNSVGGNVV